MNARAVRFLLGSIVLLLAAALLAPAAVALGSRELTVARGFGWSALIAGLSGCLLLASGRGSLSTTDGRPAFFRREAIAVVGLGWMAASVVGALPFLLCGTTSSGIDAFFESVSGFTTTGSSVFSADQIEAFPRGINFWRCFSQWIGGIGIVLVFVTLLPAGGRSLFRSEGIDRQADEARVRDSALRLLRVYVVLTAACTGLLLLAGLSLFDASVHAFAAISTGGFSSRGASVGHYDSPLVEAICILFMIAGGTTFVLWTAAAREGLRSAWARLLRSSEVRAYLGLLVGITSVVTLILWFWGGSNGRPGTDLPDYSSFLRSLRHAAFSVVTLHTTTGFATADFERWPDAARLLLMVGSFVGACAESTGGGIKIVRLLIVARAALASIRTFARPRAIVQVRLDGESLGPGHVGNATRYLGLWLLAALLGAIALALLGSDITESITGVIACLNTTGPGLGGVGPNSDFGHLLPPAKLVLSALMILGRLEFFAVIALLMPGFWRR